MALTDENSGVGTTMLVQPTGMGGANGDGFFGGNSGWWIILLFILLGGWGNGNWGGNGAGCNGAGGLYPWMNQSNQINGGFRDQMINSQLTGIQQGITSGFGDVQAALCSGFAGTAAAVTGAQNAITQQMYTNQIADMERSYAAQTANTAGMTALQAQLIDSTIHSVSGDDAFVAGKGPVSVGYGRSGRINYVLLNTETDYFLTGLPGAYTTIRYERCDNEPGWYVSSVETTYQKGDYIAAVQAEYRNDAVNSLGSYRVTYDDGRDGLYTITYAPNSRTVLQVGTNFVTWYRTDTDRDGFPDTLNTVPSDAPTQTISKAGGVNVALIHHDTDEILSGVYVKGGLTLTSGSGKKLGSWYKDRSKQYPNEKYGLRPCTSFPSPRVE